MKKYVSILGLIGVIFAGVVYVVQDVVITVLYGATSYHNLIAFFLKGFLLALPFTMMIGYFSISLYSMKDTKSVLVSNFVSTCVAVFVCYSTQSQGNISLVYGVSSMAVSNFLLLFLLYSRKKL